MEKVGLASSANFGSLLIEVNAYALHNGGAIALFTSTLRQPCGFKYQSSNPALQWIATQPLNLDVRRYEFKNRIHGN